MQLSPGSQCPYSPQLPSAVPMAAVPTAAVLTVCETASLVSFGLQATSVSRANHKANTGRRMGERRMGAEPRAGLGQGRPRSSCFDSGENFRGSLGYKKTRYPSGGTFCAQSRAFCKRQNASVRVLGRTILDCRGVFEFSNGMCVAARNEQCGEISLFLRLNETMRDYLERDGRGGGLRFGKEHGAVRWAAFCHQVLGHSWDRIAQRNGLQLTIETIHLNGRGAAIVARLGAMHFVSMKNNKRDSGVSVA